jgi:tetratricopeptide (TPR) repeat protein
MDGKRYTDATALRDAGKLVEALEEFEALADLAASERERSDLLGNQANCLWRLGRLGEARQRLGESQREGKTPSGELLEAYICVSEERGKEAEEKLKAFLERYVDLKESEHRYIYFCAQDELGKLLFDSGRYTEAVEPLREALTFFEDIDRRRWLNYCLGVCYYWSDQWDAAIEKFRESLPSDRRHTWWAETQYYIGICHARLGKLDLAEQELTLSLPSDRSAPRWVLAQFELGCIFFRRGAFREAKSTFKICELIAGDVGIKGDISKWLRAARDRLGQGADPIA